jgi:nucleoside-diphosphate-sugar epimerase
MVAASPATPFRSRARPPYARNSAKEERLRVSGVRFVIVRLPQFYGPHVQTLTGPPLKRIVAGRTGLRFGPPDVPVEFVFMPDAARVLLDVGLAQEHGQTFHLPGDGPTTPQTLFSQAIRIAGAGNFAALPGWTVRAAGVTDGARFCRHPSLVGSPGAARWYEAARAPAWPAQHPVRERSRR